MDSKAAPRSGRVRIRKAQGTYHHGDLKHALVAAAEQLIARTGSLDLSLREVAACAGVSHAAAYRHFRNKTELLAELARRGFAALQQTLTAAVAELPPPDRLHAAGVAYVQFASSSPGLFRVMFHPSLKPFSDHPDLLQAASAALAILKGIVDEVADDAQPWSSMAAWATIHGQAVLQLDQQLVATFGVDESQAEAAATFVLRVLADGLSVRRRHR